MSSELELELNPPYASMAELYSDVERNLVLVLDAHAAEGIVPTCRAGCDACCHQLVMTTVAEAGAAAGYLKRLPAAAGEPLRARLADWKVATADLRARLQDAGSDLEAQVEELAAEYWKRRVPCPFLVDRRCAVYEVRPLACRHHFSVSDPLLCDTGDEAVIERMEAMDEAFFASQDAIPDAEAEIGMFPELVGILLD